MFSHKSFLIAVGLLLTGSILHAEYIASKLATSFVNSTSVTDGVFSGWRVMRSSEDASTVLLWGQPVSLGRRSPEEIVTVVQRELSLDSEFELVANNRTPARTYLVYRQIVQGHPVLSGRLDIALNRQGEVSRVRVSDFSEWRVAATHKLSQFVAGDYLAVTLEPANWQVENDATFACWYPDLATRSLRPAYWLKLAGPLPHQRHVGFVDAGNGEIILEWSGIAHDVFNLSMELPYWQPYDHSPVSFGPCAFQNVSINNTSYVTSLSGTVSTEAGSHADVINSLTGTYVWVTNDDTGEESLRASQWSAPFGPVNWNWTTDDATRPELNLYYHTEFVHDWYKVLDPAYNALDYPMPAVANYGSSYDNAFWNGYGTYYGSGSTYGNFAMFSDVIYHEYNHGVTDGVYPEGMLPYTGQSGAMNEAWSDYFACTINNDPLMGEWLTGNPNSSLRNLESTIRFPQNWVGQVHTDSPFISAPLWRLRNWLGAGYTDSLGHFARYALSETFFDYLVAVLEADDLDGDLTNGTPHDAEIYEAFGRSGIGPGTAPHFQIQSIVFDDGQSGNGLLEAGETAALTFTLFNDVELFPPAAANVQLNASVNDPLLSLNNATFNLGTLGPRDSMTIGPVQVSVAGNSHDHWGVIHLSISADQLEFPFETSLEFTIGIPKLNVLTRDMSSDVDKYVTGTLREMDRIYEHKRVAPGSTLDLSLLPDTGMVIWLSGNLVNSGLTAEDQTVLENFVTGGGRLVMSGKRILGGLEGRDFAREFLGVDDNGVSRIRMTTTIASPFPPDESYLLTGSGGAANQDSMTILQLVGEADAVLRYGPAGANYAGIVGPVSQRTLVLGFGMEAVADNTPIGNRPRSEFLAHILEWAGQPMSTPEFDSPALAPNDFALKAAYPNPFNSSVRIEFTIGSAREASLLIYDVLGREVHRTMLTSLIGSYDWTPTLASGVYFAVLHSAQQITPPQKLLLMR